jgi:hypothetical protein
MEAALVLFVGLCVIVWLLQRIYNVLKAIHYMMRHEFGKKYDLGPGT